MFSVVTVSEEIVSARKMCPGGHTRKFCPIGQDILSTLGQIVPRIVPRIVRVCFKLIPFFKGTGDGLHNTNLYSNTYQQHDRFSFLVVLVR